MNRKWKKLSAIGLVSSVAFIGNMDQPQNLFSIKVLEPTLAQAQSAETLDPSSLDLSQAGGRANFIRFLYIMIAGGNDDYEVSGGPEGGFVGIINQVTGANALGGGLSSCGYDACTDLPTTGSCEMTEEDGNVYEMTFSAGSKTVPSHFSSSAGETFDKRVVVTLNDEEFMNAEFICEASATATTGYIRMSMADEGSDTARGFETYYQSDSETSANYVDFFMLFPDSTDEKMAARLATADGDEFRMYIVRTVDSGGISTAVGVHGKKSTNLAAINMVAGGSIGDQSSTTAIEDALLSDCVDMSTNTSSDSCTSESLSVTAPDDTASLGGETHGFTINDISELTLTSFSDE